MTTFLRDFRIWSGKESSRRSSEREGSRVKKGSPDTREGGAHSLSLSLSALQLEVQVGERGRRRRGDACGKARGKTSRRLGLTREGIGEASDRGNP